MRPASSTSVSDLSFRGRTEALDAAAKEISNGVGTGRSQQHNSRRVADPSLIAAVTDFSDIIALAKTEEGFKKASHDRKRGIEMFTRPVPQSPVHMMKAKVTMPCSPREFLTFLDLEKRRSWDDHFVSGYVFDSETKKLQELVRPNSSSTLMTGDEQNRNRNQVSEDTTSNMSSLGNKTNALIGADTPTVWLKYMAFKSPLPIVVQCRDFELVVGEQVFSNGTAVLKAFSPQEGRCKPADPNYVRGFIEISGFVVEPLSSGEGCRVTYVALVDPRGMVPSSFVNILIGKQTATLAQMQRVISLEIRRRRQEMDAATQNDESSSGGGNKKKSSSSSFFSRVRQTRSHL